MPVPLDRQLADFARAQYGLFHRAQAHDIEVYDRMLRARVRRGTLDRLSLDVFRIAGAPDSWHQQLLAAAWNGGPDCCVSHRAAAQVHRYDGFRSDIVESNSLRSGRPRCMRVESPDSNAMSPPKISRPTASRVIRRTARESQAPAQIAGYFATPVGVQPPRSSR